MQTKDVEVKWRVGLHMRPASQIVNAASGFKSNISLKKDDLSANAKSVISIISLQALYKSTLTIIIEGPDEEDAMNAIVKIFDEIE